MKAIQTNQGRSSNYIKLLSNINRTGTFSAFAFLLLALTCLFPISKGEQSTEAVTGTAQSSSLTLSVTGDTASVELDVNSTEGTFASSSTDNSAAFSVTTNNFSGYTLSISGTDTDGKLYDDTKKFSLAPLTSAVSEADFSSTTSLNGKWGYKPSKFNSANNDNYLPAPTQTASTLDATTTANTTANNYTISLGLRADYGTASTTYSNAFIITAVPNPIAYVITYDANTTDTVSGMPGAQNSTTSATSINLANNTPTRTNYTFLGWCSVKPTTSNGTDSCSGITYQPNASYGIDKTTSNVTTLYAMWKINPFTVTFATGTGGTVSQTTQEVPIGREIAIVDNIVTVDGKPTAAMVSDGYAFSNWTNGCGSTMPTNNCTITANWQSMPSNAMQTFSVSKCTSSNVELVDARDNQSYNVRLINGVCTMVDNLDVQIITGIQLSKGSTNVTANRTLGTVGTLQGGGSSANSYYEMRILKSATSSYGTYYNYAAATAGTITGPSNNTEASQDICPKGWRLPTLAEQTSIAGSTSWSTTNVSAFNAVAAGSYSSGSPFGSSGYWWSSTARGTASRYILIYDTGYGLGSADNASGRVGGNSVRCVKDKPTTAIQFNSNGGSGSMDMQKIDAGQSANLTANTFTRVNYVFTGWNTEPDGSGTSYADGALYSVPSSEDNKIIVLYAQWVPATQSFTSSQCQSQATDAPIILGDIRDNKTYSVRYINGVCTMIDNLDFQITTGMTLSPDTTNVTASRTLGTVGSLTSGNSYDEARTAKNASISNSGLLYNYAAATAGTITGSSNSTEASQDICPKGWRLPTYNEQTSIAGGSGWQTVNQAAFTPVAAGDYSNGSLGGSGSYGFWWSSTASATTNRYRLYYRTGRGLYSGDGDGRLYGYSVRCVLK